MEYVDQIIAQNYWKEKNWPLLLHNQKSSEQCACSTE